MSQDSPAPEAPKMTISAETALGEYANFVSIAHNFTEVLLDFGRTLPGRGDIPVVTRIIMNPFHAKQLVRALSHNLQLYEKTFGPIPDPPKATPAPQSSSTN